MCVLMPERGAPATPARGLRVVTVALAAMLIAPGARAVEVHHLDITTGKGAYAIEMSLRIAAPPSRVIAVLPGFSYPDPVNPDVTRQEVVSVDDGITRVRTEFEGCVLFICREIELTQDVRVSGNEVYADVVPGGKNFQSGRLHWRIISDGDGGSHIEFRASMAHNFFVMPLVGGYFLKKRIRNKLLESAGNLEEAASP